MLNLIETIHLKHYEIFLCKCLTDLGLADNIDDTKDNLIVVTYKSDRQVQSQGSKDMGATTTIEINTDKQYNRQAIFEYAKENQ
ncbi:unnamed protein product [Rotaria sordida]|uniref:Uncharacterized protein n=1 Tax=Rotaria sordida TaxID=392033 RepID=A0A814MPX1_9BILA|nr:unnamed protein product [Rotaria sordida]CAF3712856.1 unnamed protein product [Rotaria sordida]